MADVEFLRLGDFESGTNKREFDAVSFGQFFWQGVLSFEDFPDVEPRIIVYSNREDPLGDDMALRQGKREEVIDAERAKEVISKAIVSCFDHTTKVEVLSDGKGGWIPLETDT